MLRSLIFGSFVFFTSAVFAHDHHDHDFAEDSSRSHVPQSCADEDALEPSEQCLQDMDAVLWIHKFLRSLDNAGFKQEGEGSINLSPQEYETLIYKIHGVRHEANPPLVNFENQLEACKKAFVLDTPNMDPSLTESFCKSLSTPHSHAPVSWLPSFSLANLSGALATTVFGIVYWKTGSIKAAAISFVSLGLVGCTCCGHMKPGVLCPAKLTFVATAIAGLFMAKQVHDMDSHKH